MTDALAAAIADVLSADDEPTRLIPLVERVLYHPLAGDRPPAHSDLVALQAEIDAVLPNGGDRLALVYGGATRVKDYVFEAPKLPEIRGASALLDWVNEVALPDLWYATSLDPAALAGRGVIFASGGALLALAHRDQAPMLASQIERRYAEWTLTANSVAVWEPVTLLELRYGRAPLRFWVEDLRAAWADPARRALLAPALGLDPAAAADVAAHAFLTRKTFGELVGTLAARFYRRRDERPSPPTATPALLSWSVRCASSGARPAVVRRPPRTDEDPVGFSSLQALSAASARKRFVGQVTKRDHPTETGWFLRAFGDERFEPVGAVDSWQTWRDDEANPHRRSWEQQWDEYLAAQRRLPVAQQLPYARARDALRALPARDVQEIAAAASRPYIGLIYADGNRVGRFFAEQTTPNAYAIASQTLRDLTRRAVFHGLASHLAPHKADGRLVHPFEILTIGGDDLLLIVPGDRALDIALAIGYAFESDPSLLVLASAQQGGRTVADRYRGSAIPAAYDFAAYNPQLSLSAGVIIAQQTAPIFFLRDLVEELLKRAKAGARANAARGDGSGTVDFMALKSITMVTDSVSAFRAAALGDGPEQAAAGLPRRTARPYTWHELAGLLAAARALNQADMPRSQLYRLNDVLATDSGNSVLASSLEYLYTRSRLDRARREQAGQLVQHIELAWTPAGSAGPGPGAPPWLRRADGQGWETIWPDLVEIYDFVADLPATP